MDDFVFDDPRWFVLVAIMALRMGWLLYVQALLICL